MAFLNAMVYNVHGCVGNDGCTNIPRIARILKTSAPEIVGLNEVYRCSTGNLQDTMLAEELGPDWTSVFGKTVDKPLCEYGNALLTMLPVISSETWFFSEYPKQERRGMVRLTVEKNGQQYHIFCTHLGLKQEMRSRHAAEALLIMSRFTDAARILMGDFNEGRGSAAVETISRTLTDTWATYGIGQEKTFSSIAPVRRIDYIWIDKDLAATSCYTARYPETAISSDHLPVVASLFIQKAPISLLSEITVRRNQKKLTSFAAETLPLQVQRNRLEPFVLPNAAAFKKGDNYSRAEVRVLHNIFSLNLHHTIPSRLPPDWTQVKRSTGLKPVAEVVALGSRKIWHQQSEQPLSYGHTLNHSFASSGFEVSARVKTVTTGGGSWRLEAGLSYTQSSVQDYAVEVLHNGRHLPRLRLLEGVNELATLVLTDKLIDPYHWNNYVLAISEGLPADASNSHRLAVHINGKMTLEVLHAATGQTRYNNPAASSLKITTIGRPDSRCEIYAEDIILREWKTVSGEERTAEDVAAGEVNAGNESTGFPDPATSPRFFRATFGYDDSVSRAACLRVGEGDDFCLKLATETAVKDGAPNENTIITIRKDAGDQTLRILRDETVLHEASVPYAQVDLAASEYWEITLRTFKHSNTIIETGFKPSTRWRGFF